jgi:hypothetical protein
LARHRPALLQMRSRKPTADSDTILGLVRFIEV